MTKKEKSSSEQQNNRNDSKNKDKSTARKNSDIVHQAQKPEKARGDVADSSRSDRENSEKR